MIVLWLTLALVVGIGIGYLVAVTRTDRLLAHMTDEELKALATRVRLRKG